MMLAAKVAGFEPSTVAPPSRHGTSRGVSPYCTRAFPLLSPYWQDRGRKTPANRVRACPPLTSPGRAYLQCWPDMSGHSNQWSKMGDTGLEPVTSALSIRPERQTTPHYAAET